MTASIRIDRSWAPTEGDRRPPTIRFCTRCGQPAEEPPGRPELHRRVCGRCGMGVLLSCARDALPGAAAFLIVAFDLSVSAVSESGESVFGEERALTGAHLLDLVASPLGNDALAVAAGQAARRAREPVVMPVRLLSEHAPTVGTLAARIATCGPPRAALVTLEPSEFGRRRG